MGQDNLVATTSCTCEHAADLHAEKRHGRRVAYTCQIEACDCFYEHIEPAGR